MLDDTKLRMHTPGAAIGKSIQLEILPCDSQAREFAVYLRARRQTSVGDFVIVQGRALLGVEHKVRIIQRLKDAVVIT